MKAVFINELRLYGLSWLGWSALLLLNIIAFFGFNAGTASYGKFDALFQMMQMPFAWAVIIVGARTFAKDKELGLYELYFTAPVPLWHIVLAKFGALTLFFALGALNLLIYPLVMSIFVNISWMSVLSGMTALFFSLLLFASLAVLASALSPNVLTAIISGFGLWMILTLLGALVPALPPSSPAKGFLESIAYGVRFNSVASGVFSWGDLIYFTALSLVLLKTAESRVLAQISR